MFLKPIDFLQIIFRKFAYLFLQKKSIKNHLMRRENVEIIEKSREKKRIC